MWVLLMPSTDTTEKGSEALIVAHLAGLSLEQGGVAGWRRTGTAGQRRVASSGRTGVESILGATVPA